MSDPLTSKGNPWLTIIGLGEDGLSGLSDASRASLETADLIFGGPRHLELVAANARGVPWQVPFSTAPVLAERGRTVVVLASGDPFWHGAGGSLMNHLGPDEWVAHPAPSAFALAANRLGWKLEEVLCLGLHAAPYARLFALLHKGERLLCTLRDGKAPEELCRYLTENGFGKSTVHIMERLGGPKERIRDVMAEDCPTHEGGAPVLAAIEATGTGLPRAAGLPDAVFAHKGQITKRPIRALTLSALAPRAREHLWDIGGGSGSISVEWCLAAPGATATTLEPRSDRLALIKENVEGFGLGHRIKAVEGHAPDALVDLPPPDCVFIGGGATTALLEHLWLILPKGCRMIANAVTLETQALLVTAQAERGGHLMKVELSEAAPLGTMRGWAPARPVVQWSVTR